MPVNCVGREKAKSIILEETRIGKTFVKGLYLVFSTHFCKVAIVLKAKIN